jgi:competence protein ComEA
MIDKKRNLAGFTTSPRTSSAICFTVGLILIFGCSFGAARTAAQEAPAPAQTKPDPFPALPNAPGKDVLLRTCSSCHTPLQIIAQGRTRDGWIEVITQMTTNGAQGSDDDFNAVLDYLAKNFPPGGVKTNMNKATAAELTAQLTFTAKDAAAIVAYRDKSGPFKSVDDVKKVPDIDAKVIDSSESHMVFE